MGQITYSLGIDEDAADATLVHFCPRTMVTPEKSFKAVSGDYAKPTGQLLHLVDVKDRKRPVLSEVVSHKIARGLVYVDPCPRCGLEFFLTWARNRLDVETTLPELR